MSRRQPDPLRTLDAAERAALSRLSRSRSAPAAQVARARALLAVADGQSYTTAAKLVGRHTGDTVARWVAGFNRAGLAALVPGHGGGHRVRYGAVEQRRILTEVARPPDRARATCAAGALRDRLCRDSAARSASSNARSGAFGLRDIGHLAIRHAPLWRSPRQVTH